LAEQGAHDGLVPEAAAARDGEAAAGEASAGQGTAVRAEVGAEGSDVVSVAAEDPTLHEGLARAMHDAAAQQHERLAARIDQRRLAALERLREDATQDVSAMRRAAEADEAEITAWAVAEIQRVERERDRRLQARRERLASDVERRDALVARGVVGLEAAVDGYRSRLEDFFGRLASANGPGEIARLADEQPEEPELLRIAAQARTAGVTMPAGGTVDQAPVTAVMDPAVTGPQGPAATPGVVTPPTDQVGAGAEASDGAQASSSAGHGATGSLLSVIPALRPTGAWWGRGPGGEGDSGRR
jgi:hypothetical protein